MRVADTIIWGRTSFAPSAAYWTQADGDVAAWPNATLAVGDGVRHVSDRRTLTLRSARTYPSGTIAAIYSARG